MRRLNFCFSLLLHRPLSYHLQSKPYEMKLILSISPKNTTLETDLTVKFHSCGNKTFIAKWKLLSKNVQAVWLQTIVDCWRNLTMLIPVLNYLRIPQLLTWSVTVSRLFNRFPSSESIWRQAIVPIDGLRCTLTIWTSHMRCSASNCITTLASVIIWKLHDQPLC